MGRPKSPATSAEFSARIARVQEETQAQVRQLEERRRAAEARENQRRGELISSYLAGPKASDLRQVLRLIVEQRDRQLFDLEEQRDHVATTTTAPPTESRPGIVTSSPRMSAP